MWQDEYISKNDSEYICWDHRGEWIGMANSLDHARKIVEDYVSKIKYRTIHK